MKPLELSRRSLLRGSAGIAVALPWLEAMVLPGSARAQSRPKRLVVFASVLGTYPEQFWPRLPGATPWQPGQRPAKAYVSGTTAVDTTDFTLEVATKALEPHKKDLLFVEGVDPLNCNGHGGYCNLITAAVPARVGADDETGGGISIDQAVARQLGKDSRFASLQVGAGSGGSEKYGVLSFYDTRKPAPAEGKPRALFDRVFAGVAGGSATEQAAIERLRRQRRSVLDGALGQAGGLKARLGRDDQQKLDSYLQSFRDLEARLATTAASGGCMKPSGPTDPKGGTAALPEVAQLQIENLAMAFACDLTRVSTFQIGFEGTVAAYTFLGVTTRQHDLSHCDYDASNAPDEYVKIGKITAWQAEVLAALVTRLKQIPEGSGTVFDNTMILWMNGLTYGATHSNRRNPIVMVGGAGGAFRTGRYVRLAQTDKRTTADLFVPIARAYGIDTATFGDPKYNLGALTNLRG